MSAEECDKDSKKKTGAPLGWMLVIIIVAAGGLLLTKLFEMEKPRLTIETKVSAVGRHKTVQITAVDQKSGIRSVEATIQQGSKKALVFQRKIPRAGLFPGSDTKRLEQPIDIDAVTPGFIDGPADLTISVRDFSFMGMGQGNEAKEVVTVSVDTKSPKIEIVVESPVAIKPGGSGLVVYRSEEEITDHGVTINGLRYPGFPILARGKDTFGALIGVPHDTEKIDRAAVTAQDLAGNPVEVPLGLNLRRVVTQTNRIAIDEAFLQGKMPELVGNYPEMKGDLLAQYLYANRKVRESNQRLIRELTSHATPERLWDGAFGKMRRSTRKTGFADQQSYFYQGAEIDKQVNLGIDLASVPQAPVEAVCKGRVVFADYMGIYGNMVVLDHGLGVFTLYAHLSAIEVKVGELVEKEAVIGRTGSTGMADGDYLHFAVLINGVFVNPAEWWDSSWLSLNVFNYLAPPAGPAAPALTTAELGASIKTAAPAEGEGDR